MRIYVLLILLSLIIYAENLGYSETPANSYEGECKTYELENDLGDSHCCYCEFINLQEENNNNELQKFCIYLTKDEYKNQKKFIEDMKKGEIEDFIKADIKKLDCGSSGSSDSPDSSDSFDSSDSSDSSGSSYSSYLAVSLLSLLNVILILI